MGKLDDIVRALGHSAPESKYIRAYHGSPYDFDRFDASKIGSGEGGQAYGHGLYFAGNEDIAEFYRSAVTATKRTPEQDAQEFIRRAYRKRGNLTGAVLDVIDQADAAHAEALSNGMEEAAKRWNQIRDAAGAFNIHGGVPDRIGRTYEVEIRHPEAALLDYDRPFSTPAGVRAARVLADIDPGAVPKSVFRDLRSGMGIEAQPRATGRNPLDRTAGAIVERLAQTPSGANALLNAGIPGVRYLDGNSRNAAQGTRNYVMFPGTEDSIRILRKYGLAAPIAAGAMQDQQ